MITRSTIYKKILIGMAFIFIIPSNSKSQSFNYPIVFVSRNHESNGNILYPNAGLLPGMGSFSRFKVVGGKLMTRNANGNVTTLIDSTMKFGDINIIDVQQPCVHWSGNKIVFAGIEHRDSSWRIYEIRTDGLRMKKITLTDRNIDLTQFGKAGSKFRKYDDIDPIYLPDGKIIFASTRFPTLSIFGGKPVTNLYIVDSTSTNMFRITTERNSGEKPSIDPFSGKIIYSRWWVNIDRPSNLSGTGFTRTDSLALTTDIGNVWQTNIINPDGDGLKLYATDPRTRKSFFSYRSRIMPNESMVGLFIPHTPMLNTGGSPGIRYNNKGLTETHTVIGVDSTTPLFVQSPPSFGTMQAPYATDPVPLPNGKIMLSYASTVIEQDYGIYSCDLNGTGLTQIIDLPGTLELNAELLIPRVTPPRVNYLTAFDTNLVPPTTNPNTFYQGGLFRFDCLNVYANAPVDSPIDDAPPIQKNAKFRFFLNFQREDENGQDHPIMFREIDLDRDGKIAEGDIPANVSLFEQLIDSSGNLLVNKQGNFSHVLGMNFGNNGSGTKCVGCHVGHTLITVPVNVTEGSFTNLSTSAKVRESSFRESGGVSYKGDNVVDRKARTLDQKVNWISNGGVNEYVVLKWDIPVDVRRFILYDITPNSGNGTDIHVTDCELFIYYNNAVAMHLPSTGPLNTEGITIPINPWTTMDSVKIVVKSFSGMINNLPVAGLAEVETNSRVSSIDLTGVNTPVSKNLDYKLEQNYPNPFNPATLIKFTLPEAQNVTLEVFDITGRTIATLVNGKVQRGNNSISFNASNLSSGIYFYKLTTRTFTESKRMILIK